MLPQGKVLLVDDSLLFRSHLRSFLASMYAFRIEEIPSAQKLEPYLTVKGMEGVLLLIIDIDFAQGYGVAAIESFQRINPESHVPLILTSAYIEEDTVTRAAKMGTKDLLKKPLSVRLLTNRIDSVLSGGIEPAGVPSTVDLAGPVKSRFVDRSSRASRVNAS